ncbi:hypothetical protein C4561_03315 [candidate division WWE3 bacterium]|jgi:hypothetical protein|uniref:HEAT repeat domain-containing protein n=1 Tax=candidate division WWE3 bacterium TaxID=2053526 RepID=A0A3A4ZBY3_UNCKA|nr:MAG: hypothetical protein C4561_03315 [candidate division WWE3 bacterium]
MNNEITKEMEIIWSDDENYSVDQKLESFKKLGLITTKTDLPQLLELLESPRNDFWTREMLSVLISKLGGPDYLHQLFNALKLNDEEEYDSDTLRFYLTEMAELHPEECKNVLTDLLSKEDFEHRKYAEWLLEFCK